MTETVSELGELMARLREGDQHASPAECRLDICNCAIMEEAATALASAEARIAELTEALTSLAADAEQIMSKHDPNGAEVGMAGDEASRRVHDFVADAAPFIEGVPARARSLEKQDG